MVALGARRVVIWSATPDAEAEAAGLQAALSMAGAMLAALGLGGGHFAFCTATDPQALRAALDDSPPGVAVPPLEDFDPDAPREMRLRASLDYLLARSGMAGGEIALLAGAPCGGLDVSAACTLCLACTRACPTGALDGDPRAQILTFQETAWVQCGLCARICPEQAVVLVPRLGTAETGLRRTLAQDEAALCKACGRPFGGRRTIEGVIARLRRLSPTLPERDLDRLRCCEACRIDG